LRGREKGGQPRATTLEFTGREVY